MKKRETSLFQSSFFVDQLTEDQLVSKEAQAFIKKYDTEKPEQEGLTGELLLQMAEQNKTRGPGQSKR